jgi:hypothetical protein
MEISTVAPTKTVLSAALCFAHLFGSAAWAAEPAGTVKNTKGTVRIEREGKRLPVAVGDRILGADRVLTGADGAVSITLRDNTWLSAGPHSTLEHNRFTFDSSTHVGTLDATVKRGTLSVISGKLAKASPEHVIFRTPSATLGVRGAEFIIDVADLEEA